MKLYVIKDLKAGCYDLATLVASNDPIGLERNLRNVVNSVDVKNFLVSYTSDFQLWSLGEIDGTTGVINNNPELVIDLITLKENK